MSFFIRDSRLGFGVLPIALLEKTTLSPMARLLWAVLDSFGERIFAGQALIAFRLGLKPSNKKSVRRYLHELADGGFLDIQAAKGETNVCRLTLPEYCFINDPEALQNALGSILSPAAGDPARKGRPLNRRAKTAQAARLVYLDERRARIYPGAGTSPGSGLDAGGSPAPTPPALQPP